MEMALFILGALLLCAGLLGGGFEVKELKVPRIQGLSRFLCSLVGTFLITVGVALQNAPEPVAPTPEATSQQPDAGVPVSFTIRDELGSNQIRERVRIMVNGREVGVLDVSENSRTASVTVQEPREDNYSYFLEVWALFDQDGERREMTLVGQGTIAVTAGSVYDLVYSYSENNPVPHLEVARNETP